MRQEVEIRRLGLRGDGIADGPVYAARCLPGERVEGAIEKDRIADPRILSPSAARVRPPCRHYGGCGGCALQHASDGFVAEWKTEVIALALAARGLEAEIRPIATSPPASRRRAAVSGKRLKSGPVVGFHTRGSEIVREVPDCLVLSPELVESLPALRALTEILGSRKGELTFAVTQSEAGVDVAVSAPKAMDRDTLATSLGIAAEFDLARLSVNGEILAERRPPYQRIGQARVVPPPGAFLQATRHGEEALQAAVREAVGGARRIADLFSGCGTFTLDLASDTEVHAVEADPALLAALDRGWRFGGGLRKVSTEVRDLFRRPVLAEDLDRFDAVVIDPPRAGAEAQTQRIADSNVTRVAAVSCNPVTFARDAEILVRAGFRIKWVQPVDQFRWSTHVELAACLTRDHMPGKQDRKAR